MTAEEEDFDIFEFLIESATDCCCLLFHFLALEVGKVVEGHSGYDSVELVDLSKNLLKTMGYLVVRVVDQSISNYVVKHFQVVLGQLVQVFQLRTDAFVLLFYHTPEKVVFECLQKVAYFVPNHT